MLQTVRTYARKGTAAVTMALVSAASFAQTADPVIAAMTEISGKVSTYSAGLVALAVVGVGFMVGVKYIKKARGAS